MKEYRELVKYEVSGKYKQVRVVENIVTVQDGAIIRNLTNHSKIINPGDDYSKECPEVFDLCSLLHTEELIQSYALSMLES